MTILLRSLLVIMLAATPAFSGIVDSRQQQILFVVETHGSGGDSVVWKSTKDLLGRKMNAAYTIGANNVSQTAFPSAAAALNAFGIMPGLSGYNSAIAGYLKGKRLAYARVDWFYNFTDAGDSNAQKKVYLPLLIYPDGTVRNLGVRVISDTPRVLYYIYRSLAVADSLPTSWTYPDGGVLYKYVLDAGLNIISSSTVNTNGAYDPPQLVNGDTVANPDQGLELLISQAAVPDMANYSALYSIIDYARMVAPYYNCDAGGNCTAVVSVESLSRAINEADSCTGPGDPLGGSQYNNAGRVGYTLQYQAGRYIVQPDGNYTMTASSTGYAVSPTQNFNKSVTIDSSQNAATLAGTIINPFPTDNTLYDYTNDTYNNLPCNQYIFAGTQCAQAPITVNAPMGDYNFTMPRYGCGGTYLVSTSVLQQPSGGNPYGAVRWRVFAPSGSCLRFDSYMYSIFQTPVPVETTYGPAVWNAQTQMFERPVTGQSQCSGSLSFCGLGEQCWTGGTCGPDTYPAEALPYSTCFPFLPDAACATVNVSSVTATQAVPNGFRDGGWSYQGSTMCLFNGQCYGEAGSFKGCPSGFMPVNFDCMNSAGRWGFAVPTINWAQGAPGYNAWTGICPDGCTDGYDLSWSGFWNVFVH